LQKAAVSGQCAQLQTLGPFFTAPDCPVQIAQMRNMKVLGSASYGTGGVIDATDAQFPKGLTWAAAVGKDNKWTMQEGAGIGHRTVGTTASDVSGFASAVNGTVSALRSKNCAAFIKYSSTATNNPHECDRPFASGTARALTNQPKVMPKSTGGNATYQFYSLSLKGYPSHPGATYLTFSVARTAPGPGVTFPYATLVPTTATR
jgi:hypothetical protein